ncbi:MAG: hypothetical protein C4292_02810, partial [Nitrososphaera sp.]
TQRMPKSPERQGNSSIAKTQKIQQHRQPSQTRGAFGLAHPLGIDPEGPKTLQALVPLRPHLMDQGISQTLGIKLPKIQALATTARIGTDLRLLIYLRLHIRKQKNQPHTSISSPSASTPVYCPRKIPASEQSHRLHGLDT